MSNRTLEDIILEINVLPALFRKAADSGLKTKWWQSLPIPGLFKPIKFDELYPKLDKIISTLEIKITEIHSIRDGLSSEVERAYASALIEEYSAFAECAKRLRAVYFGLYQKSLGSKGSSYPVEQYRSDLRSYEEGFRNYYSTSRKVDYFIEKVVNQGR
jgi:hypothetical protein